MRKSVNVPLTVLIADISIMSFSISKSGIIQISLLLSSSLTTLFVCSDHYYLPLVVFYRHSLTRASMNHLFSVINGTD